MARTSDSATLGHILPDVLTPDLRIVFCGTAASRISAAKGYNYANPGNLFWPTLKAVALLPPNFNPLDFTTLPTYGLGLTDLAKTSIGNDDELGDGALDVVALRKKIERFQPRYLAFTSKFGASTFLGHKVEYGRQAETIKSTHIFVLPSTSGRARRFFDVAWWQELAQRSRDEA